MTNVDRLPGLLLNRKTVVYVRHNSDLGITGNPLRIGSRPTPWPARVSSDIVIDLCIDVGHSGSSAASRPTASRRGRSSARNVRRTLRGESLSGFGLHRPPA